MDVWTVFFLLAAILMGISAFFEPSPRPSLYKLAWACFIVGIMGTIGHFAVHT